MQKILIIDYYEYERERLKLILKGFGEFSFTELTNVNDLGEISLDYNDISLIILDLKFPTEKEGFDLINYFKTNAESEKIPIILVSKSDDVQIRNHALSLGVNDFIVKPYTPKRMEKSVRSLINVYSPEKYTITNADIVSMPVESYINREFKLATRSKKPLTLILITPNENKHSEDSNIHVAAKEIVYHIVSEKLKDVIRSTDTALLNKGQDILIILPFTDSFGASQVINKIKTSVSKGLEALEMTFDDYFVYDYSTFPDEGKNLDMILMETWKKIKAKLMLEKLAKTDIKAIKYASSQYSVFSNKK